MLVSLYLRVLQIGLVVPKFLVSSFSNISLFQVWDHWSRSRLITIVLAKLEASGVFPSCVPTVAAYDKPCSMLTPVAYDSGKLHCLWLIKTINSKTELKQLIRKGISKVISFPTPWRCAKQVLPDLRVGAARMSRPSYGSQKCQEVEEPKELLTPFSAAKHILNLTTHKLKMYMTVSQSLYAVKGTPSLAGQELLAHLPEACEDPSLEKGSPLRLLLKAEQNGFAGTKRQNAGCSRPF